MRRQSRCSEYSLGAAGNGPERPANTYYFRSSASPWSSGKHLGSNKKAAERRGVGLRPISPMTRRAYRRRHRPGDVQGAHQRAKLALVFPGERGTPFSGWSKAKSALTPHPVFPAGGYICAGRLRQGCSASACALKSPRRWRKSRWRSWDLSKARLGRGETRCTTVQFSCGSVRMAANAGSRSFASTSGSSCATSVGTPRRENAAR